MTTNSKTLSLMTLAAAVAAQAQTNQPAPAVTAPVTPEPPALSPAEQTIQNIKNPIPWMNWGADFRLRNEYYNNDRSIRSSNVANHEQDYFRFRARIWTSITPVKDIALNARLSTEPREYMNPSNSKAFGVGRTGFDWSYGIVDQLNVQYNNAFTLPASITVGRQDILLNDGWLTGDGTPLDGSWTSYLDAARLTYNLKEQNTTIDVIGVAQNARADEWFPTIDEQNRAVADQNERGAILNVSNKSIQWANLDGYFIYKHDDRVDPKSVPSFFGATGDNADIYTLGGRLSGLVAEHWRYSAEGAYQFGEKQDPSINNALLDPSARTSDFRTINAFGVNSRVAYVFNDPLKNEVGLAYEYLTGDDPKSKNDEMFDILWGRYPRWTDLYTFTLASESRIAQYANMHRIGPTWTITPVKKLTFSAAYFALLADQSVPTRVSAANEVLYSRTGTFRGHYLQSIARYRFNPHVTAMLQGELLFPGDYYVSNAAVESFVRAELNFTF